MATIDLNCDLGEGGECDAALMALVSSANISCGAHAGDEHSMRRALQLARDHGVTVGAHPGFPDREHFGRRELMVPARVLRDTLVEQFEALSALAKAESVRVRYVKPHGALYNLSARDPGVAEVIAEAVRQYDSTWALVGLAGSRSVECARRAGLRAVSECFADRSYQPDGSLTPRGQAGAVIEDEEAALRQVLLMVREKAVIATGGTRVGVLAETVCAHGDGRTAVKLLSVLRARLEAEGVEIRSPLAGSDESGTGG